MFGLTGHILYSSIEYIPIPTMSTQRINRIIGQLKGIQRMMETERDCNEVLQQVSAVKKAIDGLSKELVVADICKTLPKENTQKIERVVERVLSM
jgi:DNA-binding FrmR family transcriptional regulator